MPEEEIAQALPEVPKAPDVPDAPQAPQEVVMVPYSLLQSFMGKYYIGRTPTLSIRSGLHCWGGIVNPRDSDADVFIDNITISNTSSSTVFSRIWINSSPTSAISVSTFVTPANTVVNPVKYPRGCLSYAQSIRTTPADGQSLASQFTGPFRTETQEFGGKIIIPPCGCCIVFCYSHDPAGAATGAGAFGQACEITMQWWEQPIAE